MARLFQSPQHLTYDELVEAVRALDATINLRTAEANAHEAVGDRAAAQAIRLTVVLPARQQRNFYAIFLSARATQPLPAEARVRCH